jgi:hypothetical protein
MSPPGSCSFTTITANPLPPGRRASAKYGLSPFLVAATTADAAAAMLTFMIVDTMIPEAFAQTHDWSGLIAVIGFLVSFSLTQLTG